MAKMAAALLYGVHYPVVTAAAPLIPPDRGPWSPTYLYARPPTTRSGRPKTPDGVAAPSLVARSGKNVGVTYVPNEAAQTCPGPLPIA